MAIAVLGCAFPFGPEQSSPEEDEEFALESCEGVNHADYWKPAEDRAALGTGSPTEACYDLQFYSAGGGQAGGSSTFHIEPQLVITDESLTLPDEPAIFWTVSTLDGEVLAEEGIEIYEYDLIEGREVWSQVFIPPEARGKNVILHAEMELVDDEGNRIDVAPEAAARLVP